MESLVADIAATSPSGTDPTLAQAAPGGGPDCETQWDREVKKLGVFTPARLGKAVKNNAVKPFLVAGLLRQKTVNVLVGDSGLGKTPFGIQLGLSIAAGKPFLGRPTHQGPVLFCDAESDQSTFHDTLSAIGAFMGLPALPPEFLVWSPNWEAATDPGDAYRTWADKVITCAHVLKPSLVIVDPLRMFWPDLEGGNDRVPGMIKKLRETGAAWVITHHRRKTNQQFAGAALKDDPHGWFQEAAGSHAIVNQTDTRMGVVPHPGEADLLVGGFIRGSGPFAPLDVKRRFNPENDAQGYELADGANLLIPGDRTALASLPDQFTYTQAKKAIGGNSDSNADRLVKRCLELGLVIRNGRQYIKVQPPAPMESVESVEAAR